MTKLIRKNIIRISLLACLSLLVSLPALAANTDRIGGTYNFKDQSGLNAAANIAGYETGTSASTIDIIIGNIITVLLSFVGVVFFVLIIYSGFTWMTAQGNDEKVKKAKSILKNSVIGLIITLAAYTISFFLINYFWK